MISIILSFVRELQLELNQRADRWAKDGAGAPDPEIGKSCARTASILREIASSIGAASKRTLLA